MPSIVLKRTVIHIGRTMRALAAIMIKTRCDQLLRVSMVALLAAYVQAASADGFRTITKRSDPAVAELEGIYGRYLTSSRSGDVAGFKAVMTTRGQEDTASMTPEMLRRLSVDDLEPTKDVFVRADITKDRARLVYSQSLTDRIRWQGVAFSKERAGWRISKIVETADPRNLPPEARKLLGKMGLDELLGHRYMQLDRP